MMTTMQKAPEVTVPQACPRTTTRRSGPRGSCPRTSARPRRGRGRPGPLVVGILVGAVSLAVGFGAGYWAHSHMVEAVAPIVISRVAGPVDANGMNLGRRVAPLETAAPIGITLGGPASGNSGPLGRRVAPFDTMTPAALPVAAPTDANGMNFGRRLAPVEAMATTEARVAEADTVAFGRQGGRP